MRELGSSQPTAVELEILRTLWDLGPSPVRDIHAKLAAHFKDNLQKTKPYYILGHNSPRKLFSLTLYARQE